MVLQHNHRTGSRLVWQQWVPIWREEWLRHHQNVKTYFANRPKDFLIFDIENDNVRKLISFLSETYSLNDIGYGHHGETKSMRNTVSFGKKNNQIVMLKHPPRSGHGHSGLRDPNFLPFDPYGVNSGGGPLHVGLIYEEKKDED
jgi:hypothetical protein